MQRFSPHKKYKYKLYINTHTHTHTHTHTQTTTTGDTEYIYKSNKKEMTKYCFKCFCCRMQRGIVFHRKGVLMKKE